MLCVCCVCASVRLAAQCPDGSPPPCGPRHAPPPSLSVAVLDFRTSSRDPDDSLLAEGFTEELNTSLGKVPSLVVSSRGLVRRYRGQALDPITAGRLFNTAYVVSGTLERGGGRVRVRVELARASTGAVTWSDAFERPNGDLMGLEADLASAVAGAIAGRLRPGERAALTRQPTRVPAAWEQYVRGNVLIARREVGGLDGAIAAYTAAVRLDSNFAAAWARLAEGLSLAPYYAYREPGVDSGALAQRKRLAAARALALDSSSAEAWMAVGFVRYDDRRWPEAFAAWHRAVSLDSSIAEPHYHLGSALKALSSDQATAERHLRLARALDPSLINAVSWLADLLWKEGRTFEALACFDTLFAMAPELAHGAFTADSHIELRLLSGDSAAARTELADLLSRSLASDSARVLAIAARTQAQLGETALARVTLRRVDPDPYASPAGPGGSRDLSLALAAAHTALGEYQRALQILEARRDVDGIELWDGLRASYFLPLRRDPRFARLLESVWPK